MAAELVGVVGGVAGGVEPAARVISGISTDSRSLVAGQVFVALVGEHHDGHDFLDAAAFAGASVLVCQRGHGKRSSQNFYIEVDDTLYALGEVARHHRRRFSVPVVAITGSNGKTTTKEMLRAILSLHYGSDAVLANEGNLNNLIGLPLSLMELDARHRVAVFEMGANAPGEIARLTEIAGPTHGLITSIGPAHLEGLGSIDGVARAKGELFCGLPAQAMCLVNVEDERTVEQAADSAAARFNYGLGGRLWAEAVEMRGVGHLAFDLCTAAERTPVVLGLGGRHNVTNALAAAAVAVSLEVEVQTIAEGLGRTHAPPMRVRPESLANGVTVINDCYNANPASLAAALDLLREGGDGRCIVVLGDMLELGDASGHLHEEAGRQAASLAPSLLCAVGEQAAAVCRGARSAGLDEDVTLAAAGHHQAAEAVAAVWRAGDTVLVKGSRGARMEEVVRLLSDKAGL